MPYVPLSKTKNPEDDPVTLSTGIVGPNGEFLALGNIPQNVDELQNTYTDVAAVDSGIPNLTADQLQDTEELRRWIPRGRYQGDIGACNLFTTGKILEACRVMLGLEPAEVSYNAAYWALNGGRSYSNGTMPEDALQYMLKTGMPLKTERQPLITHRNTPLNTAEREEAQLYRFDEAHLCRSWLAMASAISAGFYVNGGVMWYDTDQRPAPDGRLPIRGSGRPGGHSIVFCGLRNFPSTGTHGGLRLESGWHVLINNHHGDSAAPPFQYANGQTVKPGVWGLDGFGYLPLGRIEDGLRKFVFWALRNVRIDSAPVPVPQFDDESPKGAEERTAVV